MKNNTIKIGYRTICLLAVIGFVLAGAGPGWAQGPTKAWTRIWGCTSEEWPLGVGVDPSGNVLVAGVSYGAFDGRTNAGLLDAVLTRHAADGASRSTHIWGNAQNDYGYGVVADASGNAYFVGMAEGDINGETNPGSRSCLMIKCGPDGSVIWTRIWGSAQVDYAEGVTLDTNGNICVAGITYSSFHGQTHPNEGCCRLFLSKYTPDGSNIWTRIWGGTGGITKSDNAHCVAVDRKDNSIHVAGSTDEGFDGETNPGGNSPFVTKFTSDGSNLWTRIFGSALTDAGRAVGVDSTGSVYVAGLTSGSFDGETNPGQTSAFLTKYSADGSNLWTRIFGSTSFDYGYGLAVGPNDRAYVSGTTKGSFGGATNPSEPTESVFLTEYTSDGTSNWTRIWGSSSKIDYTQAEMAADGQGNLYVVGCTRGSFDGESNPLETEKAFFLTKWTFTSPPVEVVSVADRFRSNLMDIYYRASDTNSPTVEIRGLATPSSSPTSLTYQEEIWPMATFAEGTVSNYGAGIVPSTNLRHLVWDAGQDLGESKAGIRIHLYSNNSTNLPIDLHFVRVPADTNGPAFDICRDAGAGADAQLQGALLWSFIKGLSAKTNGTDLVAVGGTYDGQTVAQAGVLTTNGRSWLAENLGPVRLATTLEIQRAQEASTTGMVTKWPAYRRAGIEVNEFTIETTDTNAWYFVKQ